MHPLTATAPTRVAAALDPNCIVNPASHWLQLSVAEFLEDVRRRHQVLVRLGGNKTRIELDRPTGEVPDALRHAIRARSPEILAHLLGSPGLNIVGYPAELMLASHGFQEIRIAERRKRHKIVEVVTNGQTVTKWFDVPPGWRLREIAYELELHRVHQQKGKR